MPSRARFSAPSARLRFARHFDCHRNRKSARASWRRFCVASPTKTCRSIRARAIRCLSKRRKKRFCKPSRCPNTRTETQFAGARICRHRQRCARRFTRIPAKSRCLGIGPLTNIALLFAIDPQIPQLLKQLVLMCGHFKSSDKHCEWNALNDPHATAMVYAAPVARHISIGSGCHALQVTMKRAEFEEKLHHSQYGAPILEMGGRVV